MYQGNVSVIIPNYNHAQYLKQRIETVLNQTYQNFELIILDDCSTDESRAVINEYKTHPKVSRIIFNTVNSGSSFLQWEKGINQVKSEWVWIAESDDYCDLNLLEVLMSDAIPDLCGLRFCQSKQADDQGNIKEDDVHDFEEGVHSGTTFLKNELLSVNRMPNASAVIIKKEFLKEAIVKESGGFKLLGDWFIWCVLALKTDVYFTNKANNYHRFHNSTVRKRMVDEGRYFIEFPAFRKHLSRLLEELEDKKLRKELQSINNTYLYRDLGSRAMELIRNKKYFKSIPFLLKASFLPSFTIHYFKSALYWTFKIKERG